MPTANITCNITLDHSPLNVARPSAVVTFAFNTDVGNSFGTDDISMGFGGGTWTTLTRTTGTNTWTATYTPNSGSDISSTCVYVDLTKVTDAQGNPGSGVAQSPNFAIDLSAPTVSIKIDKHNLKAGDTAIVTFDFRTQVRDFTADDIISPGGTMTEPRLIYGSWIWTATFTPTAGITSANNQFDLRLSGITDPAGNTVSNIWDESPDDRNYSVDTQRPTVAITLDSHNLKVGAASTTVTFTFSESVTGFDIDDIVRTADATLSNPINTTGNVWTATLSYPDGTPGTTATIGVKLAGFTDTAGNAGSTTDTDTTQSGSYTVDTQPPTVTITMSDTDLKAGDVATVTFLFSEDVGASFSLAKVTSQGGELTNLQRDGTSNRWTALFTPATNSTSATNVISLTGVVTDAAGNALTGSTQSGNYAVDTVPPSARITLNRDAVKSDETITVTFEFTEDVSASFTLGNIMSPSGAMSALVRDGLTNRWTATFTPTQGVTDNSNVISLRGVVTDAAGNPLTGTPQSGNYAVDTVRPSLTSISFGNNTLKADQSTTVTFTFSESVGDSFSNDDIPTVENGILSPVTRSATDPRVWTATFTPKSDTTDATNVIRVNLAGVTNAAGNAGTGTRDSENYVVDTVQPRVTIALSNTTARIDGPITVTFTFTEDVGASFTVEDIVAPNNGQLSAFTRVGTTNVWTVVFTPTNGVTDDTNTISLRLAGITDALGNPLAGPAESANYIVDTQRPELAIALAETTLKADQTTTVTFIFTEDVSDSFSNADITTIENGTLSTVVRSAKDPKVWTATFTPTANITDTTNVIRVNLAGVSDLAGNAGTSTANSGNYAIDTVRPGVEITMSNTTAKIGGPPITVTFTFTKDVSASFTVEDIVAPGGQLSAFTRVGTTNVWTATFTPNENTASATNAISIRDLAGVTDAAGNTLTGSTKSANYIVDTRRPDVTITLDNYSLYAGETARVTFAFTEDVGDSFSIADITWENGALTNLVRTPNTNTWTATFTPKANITDATNVISVNRETVADTVGNTGTGTAQSDNYALSASGRPPPPPTTPTTPTTPAPRTADRDRDNIPDAQEDQSPGLPRPDGSAPVAGDGNGDGIKDSTQSAVSSARVLLSPQGESKPADAASTFVTLVAGSQDGKLIPDSDARITNLVQKDAPANLPKGLQMPIGLLDFKTTLAPGRTSETFSLYVDPALGVNGYWVKDTAGTWVNLASEAYGGKMVTEGGRMRLDFKIDDGGQFDRDGQADGVITAPGAPASMQLSIVGQVPGAEHYGFWF